MIHLPIYFHVKRKRKNKTRFITMPPEISINDVYQTFIMPSNNNQNRYQIRPMHETDITTLISIEQVTWENQSWHPKDFLRALNDPLYKCWILESLNTDYIVLGYGLQYVLNDVTHIANLCIHPNRRGRGLGGILLRHMIDYARKNDISTVKLEVNTSNTHAYMLYFNHGFRISRFLPHFYSEYSDGYRMTLIL